MVVISNDDVAAALLISLHGNNIEDYDKQDIVSNIELWAIIPSIGKNLFHQHMMNFVNKLELSDQKYELNGNLRDENYKERFLFPIKDFVSFGTDCQ